jgi:transposase
VAALITIEFSDEDKAALNYERYHHPHPFVQRKMEAVWLKSQGLAHKDICRLTDVCSTTLTSYIRDYKQGGIEALKALSFRRPASDLDDHRDSLETYFRAHPPASAKQAMAIIETLTGVTRSPERVRVFLKRMGMKCRKAGMIPAKADIKAQEDFKKANSNPGLKRQKRASALSFSLMPRTSF